VFSREALSEKHNGKDNRFQVFAGLNKGIVDQSDSADKTDGVL
jgi:hypothetical protein